MTKDDHVIICGDFGGIWDADKESKNEKHWLDWFEDRAYTLLFIDGNHENFDRLNSYTEKEWHGGKVHEYLEFIKNHVTYNKCFFGHYHDNRDVSDKEIMLFEQIIRIA